MKVRLGTTIVIVLVLFTSGTGFTADNPLTYRNFPVYPSEGAKLIVGGSSSFKLDCRSRQASVNKAKVFLDKGEDPLANSSFGANLDVVEKEFGEARNYIEKAASSLGWTRIAFLFLRDGGTLIETYGKVNNGLSLVFLKYNFSLPYFTGDWGRISYAFENYPEPFLFRGIPVVGIDALSSAEIVEDEKKIIIKVLSSKLKLPYGADILPVAGKGELFMWNMPLVYGWSQVLQTKNRGKGELKKNGAIVQVERKQEFVEGKWLRYHEYTFLK